MVLNLILIVLILFLLIVLSMIWPPDSPWSPWWKTDKKIARIACKLAEIKKGEIVYELGSGNATFLNVAAKEFKAKGVGIEIDPLRAFISRIFLKLSGSEENVKIIRSNFYKEDLSKADVIFVYLVPKALQKLRPKFIKELKRGSRIISYRYEIDLPLIKEDKENQLRLFRV